MQATADVTYANFRKATDEEVAEAKGGILYQIATRISNALFSIFGTYQLWNNTTFNSLGTLPPQRFRHYLASWMGYREYSFMKVIHTFLGKVSILEKEKVIADAFFSQHRNDGTFASSLSMKKIYEIITQTFPDEKFTYDDFLLTCNRESTNKYRKMIMNNTLSQKHIDEFIPSMEKTIDTTLKTWFEEQKEDGIEVRNASRLYASSIFSQLMFGTSVSSQPLADCVGFINSYLLKTIRKTAKLEDHNKFSESLIIFRNIVLEILNQENLPLFKDTELSQAQQKAMIFTLLFAGQETTSTLLSYILWRLALRPKEQESLYQTLIDDKKEKLEIIQNLFTQSIRKFPPAFGVGRSFGEDTCLEFKFADDDITRKRIFFKDEIIAFHTEKFAKSLSLLDNPAYDAAYVLGSGPHTCPGRKLAFTEITYLIANLIKQYKISTPQHDIQVSYMFTLAIDNPIHITLTKR